MNKYKIVDNPTPLQANIIEGICADEWELVTIIYDGNLGYLHYFKKIAK